MKKKLFLESYPELAKEWHPTLNGDKKPSDYTYGSEVKIWWQCKKNPEHEWEANIYDRAKKSGTGCPYCSGRKKS